MGTGTHRGGRASLATLRRMRAADLDAVIRLDRRCYRYPWPAWVMRRLFQSHASFWVLTQGRRIVGFGILGMRGDKAHVMSLCVAPERRRQGLGKRLMIRLLAEAMAQGAKRAWLEVRPDNHGAIRLYEDLGFRKTGTRKSYYPGRRGREPAVIMSRPL